MAKRIICIGDSNTYGYDPAAFGGARYPDGVRWTSRLGSAWDIQNLGENGREIPSSSFAVRVLLSQIRSRLPADGLCLMLGTNDLLCGASPAEAAERAFSTGCGTATCRCCSSRRRSCRAEHGLRATRSSAVPDSSPRSTAISPRSAACHSATPPAGIFRSCSTASTFPNRAIAALPSSSSRFSRRRSCELDPQITLVQSCGISIISLALFFLPHIQEKAQLCWTFSTD